MPNITNIPAPRVPFVDPRTGLVSREWYMFLFNLYNLTGQGTNTDSISDLLVGPPQQETIEIVNKLLADFGVQPVSIDPTPELDALANEIGQLPQPELGTMAAVQQDNVRYIGYSANPNINYTPPVGTTWWDGGTTLNLQMTTGVAQPVGESQYYYIKATGAISKGQLIMFTGAVGASGVLKGAPATGLTDGQYLMGVASENIALNGFGLIQSFGLVRGFNTSGTPYGEVWADGDILYYNPSYAGGLTKTIPTAPNVKATIAVVVNAASGGSGSIFVRVSTGSVLGSTDSNVQFSALVDKNIIQYDSGLGYWKNVAPSSISIGYASNLLGGTTGSIPYQSAADTTTFLADVATGNALISGGVGVAPSWGKIGLTTHVSGTLAAGNGGTGQSSYAVGDILYASTTSALAKLADVATGNALISGGVGVAPSWGKIDLTTHSTGILPTANGGTGLGGATPFVSGALVYASSTSALTTNANLNYGNSFLAVGGTVNGWDNTLSGVQTSGMSFWGYSAVGHLSHNTYFDGTNYKYVTNGYVEDYYQLNGEHVFRNAASGTAGNNLAGFNTLLTIGVTGNVTFGQSNGGIIFNKSGALVNSTLNDYEEGAFTPTFSSGTGTITSTTLNAARYTKIGRLVTVQVDVTITNAGTGGSYFQISGLPFSAAMLSPLCGEELGVSGSGLTGYASGTNMYVYYYNAVTCVITNARPVVTITYTV